MAGRMMRGGPNGPARPVGRRKVDGPKPPISHDLIDALQTHADIHGHLLSGFLSERGIRLTVNRIIGIAVDQEWHTREVLSQLLALDQRHALRAVMLHQALRWLLAAEHVLTAQSAPRTVDATDDEIPF